MAASFFSGGFFSSGFFSSQIGSAIKTGSGGIDAKKKTRNIIKPTGLLTTKRGKIQTRLEETHEIALEVSQNLANELAGKPVKVEVPVPQMSLAEIEFEIAYLIKKKLRTDEDNAMLLILIAANL